MKNKLINIICGILITTSLVIIIRSFTSRSKTQHRPVSQYENITKSFNPLTEVDFDETLIDIGKVSSDTTFHQSFTLRNSGENPLILYQVSPDCNCTNYEISKGMAMPNDSIIIRLSVDTKDKRIGMFMLNTIVQVNTQKQMYRLRLVGDVVKR